MSNHRLRDVVLMAALTLVLGSCSTVSGSAFELPDGYWSETESNRLLSKTVTIRLDPDLSQLSDAEREVIEILIDVGRIFHDLYLDSRHREATRARADLVSLDAKLDSPKVTQNLLDLFRLAKGPVVRNLDGDVVPFLPVEPRPPGKNVYPWDIGKEPIEGFLGENPDRSPEILGVRTVVREATAENIQRDLAALRSSPALGFLHPATLARLERLSQNEGPSPAYYAVPYAVAYADEMLEVNRLLSKAAEIIEPVDIDFARYLRHRALDLLKNDYEAGDASWVTGRFKNINAEIGAYEVYDDGLFGVKSFFAVSVLVKDRTMDKALGEAVRWLSEFERMLPYEAHKSVRSDIPVGVYNIVADFGQARGTNTATILPNESFITRKYGRTILLRRNILENPVLFAARQNAYNAAVADAHHAAYKPEGDFFRTLFHEIGHYLGPDLDRQGRAHDIALEENSSTLEELKADLVSLFLVETLRERSFYGKERARSVQASGIRRTLRKNQPKRTQPYATMQLMQMNYYIEKGLLEYDRSHNRLVINFDTYHDTVESMLREVMALQYDGDKGAADRFIEQYSTWDEQVHGRIAASMKEAEEYRYGLVRYAALGE